MKSKNEIYDIVLKRIKKISSELFVMPEEKIEENVDLEEYGMDSIMVSEFNDQLAELVPDLSKTLLFEYKNIKELTEYLCENYEEPLREALHITKKTETVVEKKPEEVVVKKPEPKQTEKVVKKAVEPEKPVSEWQKPKTVKPANEWQKPKSMKPTSGWQKPKPMKNSSEWQKTKPVENTSTASNEASRPAAKKAAGGWKRLKPMGQNTATPSKPSQPLEKATQSVTVKPFSSPSRQSFQDEYLEDEIAIVGLAGKYPDADNMDDFWDNLAGKRDSIKEIPRERWDYRPYFDPDYQNVKEGKAYAVWASFLDDYDKFDPLFFNISPSEAALLDPQERLVLEVAWETMEDAGYTRKQLRRFLDKEESAEVGVFIGTTTQTYDFWGLEELRKGNPVLTNASPWSMVNRISYCFNFTGPCMPVDTACSSGLTALHLACESIKRGECSTAIVGGVNMFLHPLKFLAMSRMKMVSPTGRCSAFGEDANGFVPGEGVGAVFIKPLRDALKDHDHIYATIKATGINQDGKTNGFTVPNANAQKRLIEKVIEKSHISSRTISYLEAHGTGTKLGDPIEVNAAARAFEETTTDKKFCAIGSLKANIGHLEGLAGIAGLTKVLLMMKNKQILPSIHSEVLNSNINFDATPFFVPQDLMDWEQPVIDGEAYPRRAGVSSFGAGGNNAHVIVEEYPESHSEEENGPFLIVLSAKNEGRLKDYLVKLIDFVKVSEFSLKDFAFTLQAGREAMEERRAFVVHDKEELLFKLYKCINDELSENRIVKGHIRKLPSIKSNEVNERPLNSSREKEESYLEEIAQMWTEGEQIDWNTLYQKLPYRMSLPTYAFKKDSYIIKLTPDEPEDEEKLKEAERIVWERHYAPFKDRALVENDIEDITYVPQWKNRELEYAAEKPSHVLYVVTEQNKWIGEKTASSLWGSRASYLKLGQRNGQLGENEYEVNIDHIVFDAGFVEEIQDIDSIYFLSGIDDSSYSVYDIKKLEEVQKRTTIALFRIIKNMIEAELLNHKIALKIVTNDVMSMKGFKEEKPFAAGMSGFVRGLVKEYPSITASCLDVTADDLREKTDEVIDFIVREETSAMPDDICFRSGKRYVRKLVQNKGFTSELAQPLKQNGVYFIIGGLGSIGYEFARYAIAASNAKVALIGRSQVNDDAMLRMKQIGKYDEQVIYLQADCTNPYELKNALSYVKNKWGKITGVIHSAMVFDFALLRQLEEKDYLETLSSKVNGIVTLADVLRGEDIEFMLYFSSAQAYMGNKQRVHYSTACSFVDAYVETLKKMAPYQVKIVNWGFWGTAKGKRIPAVFENYLNVRGIKPISVKLGMEILRRLLGGRFSQAVILTVNEKILEMLEVIRDESETIVEDSIPIQVQKSESIIQEKEVLPEETEIRRTEAPKQVSHMDKKKEIQKKLMNCVMKTLNIDEEDIDIETPFMDLGVDSILGFKLVSEINDTLHANLKETSLFDYSDIKTLGEYLETQLDESMFEDESDSGHKTVADTVQEQSYNVEKELSNEEDILNVFKKLSNKQISADSASQMLEV